MNPYINESILFWKYLPGRHRKRTERPQKLQCRIKVEGKKNIKDRPDAANINEEIGHWEGDTFAGSKLIEEIFEYEVYFADPYSSWQCGGNERSNGLLRRFLPQRTSFKNMGKKKLECITRQINDISRKMQLNYLTPYWAFYNNSIAFVI